MTLDEAIKHAEEVAEEQMKSAEMWRDYSESKYENHLAKKAYNSCIKCAKEHRQLVDWLKELKRLREKTEPEKCSDCINREALLRKLQKVSTEAWKMKLKCNAETVWNQCIDYVKDAPSVEPERKPGKWIEGKKTPGYIKWNCSKCGLLVRNSQKP